MKNCARRTLFPIVLFSGLLAGAAVGVAAQPCNARLDLNVPAKMRDGAVLRADLFRPLAEGTYPVILIRTPYNRLTNLDAGCRYAEAGYIAVIQDVRGRFGSGGSWYPFVNEGLDGYDTVEWAAALPGSNGKVVMVGGSYTGSVQVAAALYHPPHLAGLALVVTPFGLHDGGLYGGGAVAQLALESWTSLVAQDASNKFVMLGWVVSKPGDQVDVLPLSSFQALALPPTATVAPYFEDWLGHPDYDKYWQSLDVTSLFATIHVPAIHVGGWYDVYTSATLKAFMTMRAAARTDAERRNVRLIMGPWTHGLLTRRQGAVDFGPEAAADEAEMDIRWYDALLKGANNGFLSGKPVRLFVMGKNVWREEDDWPLARAKETRFYLHSEKGAQSAAGDGSLAATPPAQETADHYTYDPANPVPTRGGGLCCSLQYPGGPFDQRNIEERKDVLVYSTPPLERDTEVTGPISMELYVSSSAKDTDFTGKLIDVDAGGFARNVSEGILRARYRNSFSKQEMMIPGTVYKLNIEMSPTSNVFLAGHRIRLEVSSSNFPHYDRNLNTGGDQAHSSEMVPADNAVYHDREHPSAIVLPVIP
ncbi:MAG TPA: CocE/NonD family hydrolase [Candidatus Acidoferrales bacterium]|nr:CocE/NonD family hydrolase [Candidatus Acidoferrales bacterium]